MKIKLTTLGNAEVEIDIVSEKNAVESLAFWQSIPNECGICKKPIHFTFRQPQGYTYYGVECDGTPKHETTFGQHKEGGGLYFKSEWKEVQYGVIDERNAEIAKYDDSPRSNDFDKGNRKRLIDRIESAKKAIEGLGGQTTNYRFSDMSTEDLQAEIDALNDQYKRLKNR